MPKSGYLPDISGVFERWRKYYLDALDSHSTNKWSHVSLGLHNMNGALDEDYRLTISDTKWQENEDGYIVWDCQNCTEEKIIIVNEGKENEKEKTIKVPTRSKRSEIKIFTEHCNKVVQFLSGLDNRKMWVCPKCKHIMSVASTKATMLKYPAPHYRDCIYSEPIQPLTGLQTRRGSYPQQMRRWARYFSIEIEHKLLQYRLEYIKQHDGQDMGMFVRTDPGE